MNTEQKRQSVSQRSTCQELCELGAESVGRLKLGLKLLKLKEDVGGNDIDDARSPKLAEAVDRTSPMLMTDLWLRYH